MNTRKQISVRPLTTVAAVTGALVLLLGGVTPVQASGSAAAGKTKSEPCAACHGEDGRGISAEFPILAGQYASYLEQALAQYKDGSRKNAIMAGFVAALSDQDIKDLAAFYASMPSALGTPKP